MQLWESIFRRQHSDPAQQPPPEPPFIPYGWPSVEDLLRNSDEFEVAAAEVAQDDVGDLAPAVDEREYGAQHRDDAVKSFAAVGVEAIAFFAPIHFFGSTAWGIYINEPVFFGICGELAEQLGVSNWDGIRNDLLASLGRHELFHAGVELFALVMEDFSTLGHGEARFQLSKWPDALESWPEPVCPERAYFAKEYRTTFPGDGCIEEQLATAIGLSGRFRTRGFRRAFADRLAGCPPAYANWKRYQHAQSKLKGMQDLAHKVVVAAFQNESAMRNFKAIALSLWAASELWFPNTSSRALDIFGPVPWRIYRPHRLRPRRFAQLIVANLRLRDFLNAMKRQFHAGVRGGGKHQALVFPNGKKIPFATTRTVPAYLVGQVANALEISRRDVLSACGISP